MAVFLHRPTTGKGTFDNQIVKLLTNFTNKEDSGVAAPGNGGGPTRQGAHVALVCPAGRSGRPQYKIHRRFFLNFLTLPPSFSHPSNSLPPFLLALGSPR